LPRQYIRPAKIVNFVNYLLSSDNSKLPEHFSPLDDKFCKNEQNMSRAKAQRSKERKSSQSENEISGIIMGYICSLRARLEAPIVAALREENVFWSRFIRVRGWS